MLIDLNAERSARAARREGAGQAVTVQYKDDTFELPVELPASIIDRLLDPEVEIAQVLIVALRAFKAGSERSGELIMATLADQPDLPAGFMRAVLGAMEALFGADQWATFQAHDPSLQDFVALVRGLFASYGVGLGEALSSSASAGSAGTTSKPISGASTPSTPATSGPAPTPVTSLVSAG